MKTLNLIILAVLCLATNSLYAKISCPDTLKSLSININKTNPVFEKNKKIFSEKFNLITKIKTLMYQKFRINSKIHSSYNELNGSYNVGLNIPEGYLVKHYKIQFNNSDEKQLYNTIYNHTITRIKADPQIMFLVNLYYDNSIPEENLFSLDKEHNQVFIMNYNIK
jgi:hypothetical protein